MKSCGEERWELHVQTTNSVLRSGRGLRLWPNRAIDLARKCYLQAIRVLLR